MFDWNSLANGCVVNEVATIQCLPAVFTLIIRAALSLAGAVALFMIIYSGIRLVTSAGDPKGVQAARGTLTWAIVGLVVVLLSFFIINIIAYITGAQCINQFGIGTCN